MTKQEIYELISGNPAFFLATAEGSQPRVRGMLLYNADETNGIVFHTGKMKDLYKQLVNNPKVEMCFNDFKKGIQVRVCGEIEEILDNKTKDEISNHPTRAFLQPWKNSVSLEDFYKSFAVFTLKNGSATTWTMDTNLTPKDNIML